MSNPTKLAREATLILTVSEADDRTFTVEFKSKKEKIFLAALDDLLTELGLKSPYELIELSRDIAGLAADGHSSSTEKSS